MQVFVKKSALCGAMTVPSSKSGTIRAVLFGLLSGGITTVRHPLATGDGLAALTVANAFGAKIHKDDAQQLWRIEGTAGKLRTPTVPIHVENSGTAASFAIGLATLLRDGSATILGDAQTCSRSWKDETDALQMLGASCRHADDSGTLPVTVRGPIRGGVCRLSGFNSQHVSGLFAPCALLPAGSTTQILVDDPRETPYVQLTIDWLARFGVSVEADAAYRRYVIRGGQRLIAQDCTMPSDWSGIAFPLVAAACTKSRLCIENVDFSDAQADRAIVHLLQRMGARIETDVSAGRLLVHGGAPLHGIDVDMKNIPDCFPVLSVAAAAAQGETRFFNLAHVRKKETDRVALMQQLLTACGADITATADSMTVHGGRTLHGITADSCGDHRIAMAMTVCGMIADGTMHIQRAECAEVSFSNFYETMRASGADLTLAD